MAIARKHIACVCGAAIAGSSIVKHQVEELFERHNIQDVDIICCRFQELDEILDRICAIVTASKVFREYPVPVIYDVNYLTGEECEESNRRLLQIIHSAPNSPQDDLVKNNW